MSVNDAPEGIDKTLNVSEHSTHTFNANDFSYSDLESDNRATVTINSLPAVGTLLLSGSPVTAGDVINAGQLANLEYHLSSAGSITTAGFDFQIQDTGGTANGGIDTDPVSNTITLNILNVNLAPDGTDNTLTTNEDTTYLFSAADFGFVDSDSDAFSAVEVVTPPTTGNLTLSGNPVAAGQIVAATDLNTLAYTPATNANGTESFTFKVQDDGGVANGGSNTDPVANTITLEIASVNDAPSGTDATFDVDENGVHSFSAAEFGFSDTDPNNFAAVQIVSMPSVGTLLLSGTPVSVNQSINASAISNLEYQPGVNPNAASSTAFDFLVQDTGGTANGGADTDPTSNKITFNLNDVNNAPQGTDNLFVIDEDTSHNFSTADFGFNDVDAHALTAIEVVSLPTNGSLSLSGNSVTAGQSISAADLTSLTFTPIADTNGAAYASFTFKVQDDGGTANGGTDTDTTPRQITFDVTAVNDGPTGTDNSISLLEDTSYVLSEADFGFNDPKDQNNFDSVIIDSLPVNGSLTNAGAPIASGDSISLTDINSGALVFSPAPDSHGATYAQIIFTVQDDGGTANNGTDLSQSQNVISINVVAVNDSPKGVDASLDLQEDTPYQFTTGDFAFTDADNNSLQSVIVDTLPADGTLALNGVAITAGSSITANQIELGMLVFQPASDFTGSSSFDFSVQDDGGLLNQGLDTDLISNTLTFNVAPVNDAPQGADTTAQIDDNENYTLTRSDFQFTDTENDQLNGVIIDSLPESGSLTVAGNPVNPGEFVDIATIDAGNLIYTPDNNSGVSQSAFSFSVVDTGTSNTNTDLEPNDLTFEIAQINDEPVVEPDRLNVPEGSTVAETTDGNTSLLTNDSDHDQDQLTAELISPPQHGQFELFSNGTFRYVHDGSETTTDSVTYQVSDGGSTVITTLPIDITPVNDDPVSMAVANQLVTAALPFSINLPANTFTDPDPQDALEITASLANGDSLPEWLNFHAPSMTFSGSPVKAETLEITITATDQLGALAQTNFTITVEPAFAPAIEEPIQIINEPIVETTQENPVSEEPDVEVIDESEPATNDDLAHELLPEVETEPESATTTVAEPSLEIVDFSADTAIFRDVDRLAQHIETHRIFNVNSLTDSASLLNVQENRSLADLFYTGDTTALKNADLINQMDSQREQLENGSILNPGVVGGAVSVSTGLSIGYVIWLVRGGLLIGSVLSALPAWRNIDPLPVLSSLGGEDDGQNDDSLEDLVEQNEEDPKSEQGPDEGQEN